MLDFADVKLIIWDLDETLWKGTLSDNEKIYPKNEFITFINMSLDRGIVHSICSKNDYEKTKSFLIANELWDLFVFPSINWDPKGKRVKQIIEEMNLRPDNTLFVDDNLSNLHEAQYYCPSLQICTPEQLAESVSNIQRITSIDLSRARLAQYRLLENKAASKQSFSSNEEFLKSCNIHVEFHNDCIDHLDRIHDLIMRSNQLNYTKFRQEKADLADYLVKPETEAAYITVKDNFGEYGIVGFYMIVDKKVVHYLFSCRTLGMLVEQYVYMRIGCPAIDIVGDVITQLNCKDDPVWINQTNPNPKSTNQKMTTGSNSVLFKGPCDISQIFSFIEETSGVTTEFTYVNDQGISVEGYNHTSQIVTALRANQADKAKLIADTQWLDEKMLDAEQWKSNDVIVFSLLTDGNLGIYQHKESGWQIALCEKYYDLTAPQNWPGYINKDIFTSLIDFTEESLKQFSENYSFLDNSEGNITIDNLTILYEAVDKSSKLILILGSEIPYQGPMKPSYQNRHVFHKVLNEKVRNWASDKKNVYLLEVTNYINSQKDYTDTINHFQKKVYFRMAEDIITILGDSNQNMKVKSKWFLNYTVVRSKLVKLAKKILGRST